MPRRDTRSKSVPPTTRKSTPTDTTKAKQGTAAQTPPPNNAAEPSKQTVQTPAPGSGLFSQMAATAGGVAIGSVLGRALGGMFDKSSETKEQSTDAMEKEKKSSVASIASEPAEDGPVEECSMEIKQFLSCIDKEMDAKLCEGFKEAMKQCKTKAASRISLFDHL